MIRDVVTVECFTAQLKQLRRVPTVSAQQRHIDSEWFCLLGNYPDLAVIARHVDHIGISRANRSQLSFIIAIALCVRLLGNYLAAELFKTGLEKFGQAATVRRIEILHDRSLL